MSKIDKLEEITKKSLKPGEKIEEKVAGKFVAASSAGSEIVDGFFAATNHRVIVLINSVFDGRKLDSFTYGQVGSVSFNEKKQDLALCTPGEAFTLSKVCREKEKFAKVKLF